MGATNRHVLGQQRPPHDRRPSLVHHREAYQRQQQRELRLPPRLVRLEELRRWYRDYRNCDESALDAELPIELARDLLKSEGWRVEVALHKLKDAAATLGVRTPLPPLRKNTRLPCPTGSKLGQPRWCQPSQPPPLR